MEGLALLRRIHVLNIITEPGEPRPRHRLRLRKPIPIRREEQGRHHGLTAIRIQTVPGRIAIRTRATGATRTPTIPTVRPEAIPDLTVDQGVREAHPEDPAARVATPEDRVHVQAAADKRFTKLIGGS